MKTEWKKLEYKHIEVDQEAVFQIIGCGKDREHDRRVKEAYDRILPEVTARADCRCIFAAGVLSEEDATRECPAGTDVLYVISTVGGALSRFCGELFAQGDYVDGMLADAMADAMLFALEAQWTQDLRQFCKEKKLGISRRMEAPLDLPIHVQQTAFEYLNAGEELGMQITSAQMYDPVKSSGVVFALTKDSCQFHAEHDCSRCPAVNCSMRKKKQEHDFEVLETFTVPGNHICLTEGTDDFGIAVDIGTTTLAACLVSLRDGKILASASAMNRQRTLGTDVISRIQASNCGKGKQLQALIRADLEKLIEKLLKKAEISVSSVDKMIVAGNTVMEHLIMGYSCEGLGCFPFQPVTLGPIRFRLELLEGCLMPGISAYVGSDITAGLYACGFHKKEEINLFLDLGTNGEMALGNAERLLTTSTAAGPAFEGGNLSCGTGSIPGAISHVTIDEWGRCRTETIQGQNAVGICGTGVIELTAELLRTGLIDETGLFNDLYFEEGYPVAITPDGNEITFSQNDIREVQMAKSAVRAGVELLIENYGIQYADIRHVYLAGGMGFSLKKEAAVQIGLLPEELQEKITAVGNSALAGAVLALNEADWQEKFEQLKEHAQEMILANEKQFNEYYIKYMMFEK